MLYIKNGVAISAGEPAGEPWNLGDPLPQLDTIVNFNGVCGAELEIIATALRRQQRFTEAENNALSSVRRMLRDFFPDPDRRREVFEKLAGEI